MKCKYCGKLYFDDPSICYQYHCRSAAVGDWSCLVSEEILTQYKNERDCLNRKINVIKKALKNSI